MDTDEDEGDSPVGESEPAITEEDMVAEESAPPPEQAEINLSKLDVSLLDPIH